MDDAVRQCQTVPRGQGFGFVCGFVVPGYNPGVEDSVLGGVDPLRLGLVSTKADMASFVRGGQEDDHCGKRPFYVGGTGKKGQMSSIL